MESLLPARLLPEDMPKNVDTNIFRHFSIRGDISAPPVIKNE